MNQYIAGGVLVFYILSCALCGFMGYQYEHEKCRANDEAHDLAQSQNTAAAEKKIIAVVQEQGNISQEASKGYAKSFADISAVYAGVSVQQPPDSAVNRVPTIRSTPGRTCTPCILKTKIFHLSPEQCDIEEAKCTALWNWARQQQQAK